MQRSARECRPKYHSRTCGPGICGLPGFWRQLLIQQPLTWTFPSWISKKATAQGPICLFPSFCTCLQMYCIATSSVDGRSSVAKTQAFKCAGVVETFQE